MEDYDYGYDVEDQDVIQQALADNANQTQSSSFSALRYTSNSDNFNSLYHEIKDKGTVSLVYGIEDGVAYYQFALPNIPKVKLYLTKGITDYIFEWLRSGNLSSKMPDCQNIIKNVTETDTLRHIKRDRQNNATRITQSTGEYKAVYPYGTINYGKLPYTVEQLKEKLESI